MPSFEINNSVKSGHSFTRIGYMVIAATFIAQALAMGLSIYTYPVFMLIIENEYSLSRAQTSMGVPLVLVMGAVAGPFVGYLIDKWSVKKLMFIGGVMMSLGFVILSQVTALTTSVLTWVVLIGLGQVMLGPLPAMTVVASWFVSRRGTMIALSVMGVAAGGVCAPLLSNFLIDVFGWRAALLVLGIICLLISAPVILIGIIKKPELLGLYPDGADVPQPSAAEGGDSVKGLLRRFDFWRVALSFAAIGSSGIVFISHLVSWATSIGIEHNSAVALFSLAALASMAGKVFFGYLNDRFGSKNAIIAAAMFEVLGWVIMLSLDHTLAFKAGALMFAFGVGSMMPCQSAFIGRIWGMERFGRVTAYVSIVILICSLVGPSLVGVGFDATGGYQTPMAMWLVIIAIPLILIGSMNYGKSTYRLQR